jgi:phage protein D
VAGYRDMFAPRFILEAADGSDLADIIGDTVSMTYTDATKGMDKVVLAVRNPRLKYANDKRFEHGFRLKLKFGYPSNFSETRTVIVVQAAPSFPAGMPMIQLTAYDTGRDLAMGAKARNWGRVTSSYIAEQVASEFGLRADVESSDDERPQHRIQPANVTSYEYLARLAHALNWDFYVENDTLHFHNMKTNEAPSHTFKYFLDGGGILKDFTPSVKAAKPPATRHAGTNAAGTAAHSARTGPGDARSTRNPARREINTERVDARTVPASSREGLTHATPETHPETQARHARAQQTRLDMSAVEATAELVGQPRVRARQMIEIQVIEQRYTGLWRVKESTHKIDERGGYTTSLKLTRHGLNGGTGSRTAGNHTANQNHAGDGATSAGQQRRVIDTERVQVRGVEQQRAATASPGQGQG